jgi:hypothetical protein
VLQVVVWWWSGGPGWCLLPLGWAQQHWLQLRLLLWDHQD